VHNHSLHRAELRWGRKREILSASFHNVPADPGHVTRIGFTARRRVLLCEMKTAATDSQVDEGVREFETVESTAFGKARLLPSRALVPRNRLRRSFALPIPGHPQVDLRAGDRIVDRVTVEMFTDYI